MSLRRGICVSAVMLCLHGTVQHAGADPQRPPKELTSLELVERLYGCDTISSDELVKYETCMPEYDRLYPLGFSGNGVLAFIRTPHPGETGGFTAELVIQDTSRNTILKTERFSDEDKPPMYSIDDVWKHHRERMVKLLSSYAVETVDRWIFNEFHRSEAAGFPLTLRYTASKDENGPRAGCLEVKKQKDAASPPIYKTCRPFLLGGTFVGTLQRDANAAPVFLFYENFSSIEGMRPALLHAIGASPRVSER